MISMDAAVDASDLRKFIFVFTDNLKHSEIDGADMAVRGVTKIGGTDIVGYLGCSTSKVLLDQGKLPAYCLFIKEVEPKHGEDFDKILEAMGIAYFVEPFVDTRGDVKQIEADAKALEIQVLKDDGFDLSGKI